MDERKSWLRENWRVGLVLVLILGLALFLRAYFVYAEFAPAGYWTGGGDYSGGSDPFYWERALLYSFTTGKELSWDYAMNYPLGFPDVRPPLFDWFNLLGGYIAAPAFGGNAWNAMVWMLNMNAAIFGVLAIIPTYLIGKEAFNRRAGILAAFLLAVSSASLQRSHATIAVHDSWTLFFVICAFYFYLRALKTMSRRRWVENWFQRKSVGTGLRAFVRENRKSVLYAFLAGLSVAVTALSWQGWAYVPVILILIFLVEILSDRIRNQDVMGVTILFVIILAVPLLVSLPWYAVRNLIHVWWDVPFYLFLVAAALGIVFTVTRDYPWTIILPATFAAAGAGIAVAATVNPALLLAVVSGAGYFVKTKVYETIAEAQEPGMSELVLSFGWFTFYVGLGAIAYMIWQMPRRNNPAYTMLVFWTFGALFMSLAAARFIFNAAPVMALATGYALDLILTRLGFEEMRRTYRSLSEGSWRNALRKSVKPRHVIVILLLAFLIVLPNVWFAVDAGIPYELKSTYDQQIHSLLPSFLQAPGYSSVGSTGTFYFGAFGYSLPKATDYFPAGYQWLSTQDTNLPLTERPAVMAWWDYGFEITERGGHPVVADPFQNGYGISGQFILAQNETSAIGLMTLRLIEGDIRAHPWTLSPSVSAILTGYGINPDQVVFGFRNPGALAPIILANPNVYGPWDSRLQAVNTPYIWLGQLLYTKLSETQVVSLYHAVSAATGTSIGYFMVDTRLFPLSASNTGIFYAPAKLSDHRTLNLYNGQVLPYDFFQIFANTNRGQNLPIQIVQPTDQVSSTTIRYQSMFYDSMFYRAYVGYSPSVVGSSDKGIPGLDQALASYTPIPAWNMTHFRVVYRTSYYNPYPDPSNHTTAWQAMNYDKALALQKEIQAGKATGVVDASTISDMQNGMVILRYYDGALVNGTVTAGGVPLANVHVTVTDELGTPHGVVATDANGRYSAIVPFGNVTLTASTGTLGNRTLVGTTTLASTTFPVTIAQAMRVNQDLDGNGIPDWLITKDFTIPTQTLRGSVYFDMNHDGTLGAGDVLAIGATLELRAVGFGETETTTVGPTGTYSIPNLVSGTYTVQVTYRGHVIAASAITVSGTGGTTQDIAVPFGTVRGVTVDPTGAPFGNAAVQLTDSKNDTTWQTVANGTGAYVFGPLLPGNYQVTAVSGNSSAIPVSIPLTTLGFTTNLTLLPSGAAEGTTQLFGVATPYATIEFQDTATEGTVAAVTSDANGHYRVSLPAGDWNVNGRLYQGTSLFATLGRVTVRPGTTTPYSANFVDGGRVTGTVSVAGQTGDTRAHIGFIGPSGEWWIRAALGNTYLAFLPLGTYSLVASVSGAAEFDTLGVTASTVHNLALATATTITGAVYWDQNRNGRVDSGEAIPGARVVLTDDLGRLDVAVTSATGTFSIALFDNRTYSGAVSATGFAPFALGPTTASGIGPSVAWNLTPLSVSVTGTAFLNGTPILNRALAIHAVSLGGGAVSADGTTFSDGSYSLTLGPGTYEIVVDENVSRTSNAWRYQNLAADTLTLAVGEGNVAHDLTIVARALVKGNVTLGGATTSATLRFTGPDTRAIATTSVGFSEYLQAGTYSVQAESISGSTHYEVLRNATVPWTGNLSLPLAVATVVSGSVTFQGATLTTPMEVTFTRLEGGLFRGVSGFGGSYTAYLVAGNYSVRLDNTSSATSGSVSRYYRYTFQGSVTVPPAAPTLGYNLATSRSFDNTTVAGTVSMNGGGLDASLSFIARPGGAIDAQGASAPDGTYSVSLAPGSYIVYATRAIGPSAFLGTLTVPHAASTPFNVFLGPAFQLSGVTTDPSGARVPTSLNLTGAATLARTTDASGAYQILLPQGPYTVSADRTQSEQGVSVGYAGTATFDLASDTVVNLELGRIDKRSVGLTWDASQNRTIEAGASVTYSFTVHNTGNVQDTFSLSGIGAGWKFAFAPSAVTLNYGSASNATAVSVTITSPADALVAHTVLTLTATSTSDSTASGNVVVTVGIVRTRGLTLQVNPLSGTYDGQYLNYTVDVRNTGNAPETVVLSIQNAGDIAATGWSPSLARSAGSRPSGLTLSNLTVAANSTAHAFLVLRTVTAHGGVTVALSVASSDGAAVSAQAVYTAVLPQITLPSGAGASGSGVSLSAPPSVLLYAAIAGAAAAAVAALVLTRRRR